MAIILFILGAALGSFAAAQVWRLRADHLEDAKKQGEVVDGAEYKRLAPLMQRRIASDRSRCLHCGHVLAWYDLLPVVSWLSLGGKCRYCRHQIGYFEFIAEIGLGLVFVFSYIFWPYALDAPLQIAAFAIWLIALVILLIQFAYDLKWGLLVSWLSWLLALVGLAYVLVQFVVLGFSWDGLVSTVGALVIMSGIYALLCLISRERWIGLGDVELGVGLGLMLFTWPQAFVALFAANLLGCIVILPLMASGKVTRKSRIPFGPFLIVGTFFAVLFGQSVTDWYIASFINFTL